MDGRLSRVEDLFVNEQDDELARVLVGEADGVGDQNIGSVNIGFSLTRPLLLESEFVLDVAEDKAGADEGFGGVVMGEGDRYLSTRTGAGIRAL